MVLTKSKIFLFICLSFLFGVGAGSFFSLPWCAYAAVITLATVWLLFNKSQKLASVICICTFMFICGIYRFQTSTQVPTPEDINFYNSQIVRFLGVVASEPDVRKDSVKLSVNSLKIDNGEKVSGLVLTTVPTFPSFQYGDLLEIKCEIEAPGQIVTEDGTGRVFDYGAYLSRYDIFSVCYRPVSVTLRGHGYGNWFMSNLLKLKNIFVQAIQNILPEPYSSLLGGILLGAKKAIPEDLMTGFNRTGITHIVALSGFNITIIAVALSVLMQRISLSRRVSFWVSCSAIALFVVMTGAQASAVRAGIMGGLVMLGRELGRLSRITNVLLLAGTVMVAVNPRVLTFDTGFQLSFLATLGLVYLAPIFEKMFLFRFIPRWLGSTLAATMSAIFFTAPLIAFQFGRSSIVAPLVNLLVVPVIPMTMGLGFGATALALIWLPLGQVAGWFVGLLLKYIVSVTELFSGFGFASVDIQKLSWAWPIGWYACLILGIFIYKRRNINGQQVKTQ